MDSPTALGTHAPQHDQQADTEDLQALLEDSADMLARASMKTAETQDPHATLATIHHVTQRLSRLQSVVASRRDEQVLNLWASGKSQAEIALFLGVPKTTVHAILAERRAQASPQKQKDYARRAAEEFEAEALVEIGNLFAAQELRQG